MANTYPHEKRSRYGSPFISRTYDRDCLNLANRIIKEMPKASTAKRAAELERRTEDDPDLRGAVFAYFMNRAEQRQGYHSASGHEEAVPPRRRSSQEETDASRKKVAVAADEIIKRITHVAILDFTCPNGKTVRENTGIYVEKLGGNLAVIGRAAGRKVVGKALTDTQAAKLLARS